MDRCIFLNKTKFEFKYFLKSKRDGYGQMIYSNGDKYQGNWVSDKKVGMGSYKWINQTTY